MTGPDPQRPGFTLLVQEQALAAVPEAGAGTSVLALHDLVFS